MTIFEWREIFEVGVPEIDSDHQELLALAKQIGEAVFKPNNHGCKDAVADFVALINMHFNREEAILQSLGYPDLPAHITYHTKLLDSAAKMKTACDTMRSQHELEECYRHMVAFLIDDIVRGDFAFKSFLQHKGYRSKG